MRALLGSKTKTKPRELETTQTKEHAGVEYTIREPRFCDSVTGPQFPATCAVWVFLGETKQAGCIPGAKIALNCDVFSLVSSKW